jgi:hypothetical protein
MEVVLTNGDMKGEINESNCRKIMEEQNNANRKRDYRTTWSMNYGDRNGPKFVEPFRIIFCYPTYLEWANVGIDATVGPFTLNAISTPYKDFIKILKRTTKMGGKRKYKKSKKQTKSKKSKKSKKSNKSKKNKNQRK